MSLDPLWGRSGGGGGDSPDRAARPHCGLVPGADCPAQPEPIQLMNCEGCALRRPNGDGGGGAGDVAKGRTHGRNAGEMGTGEPSGSSTTQESGLTSRFTSKSVH